jgi:hypothetical protein
LGTKRKHDFDPYWEDEKDWLCTVGLLPTDDPEARLYSADIAGGFALAHLLIAIRCAMGISFDAVLEQRKSTPSKFNTTRRGPMAGAKRSRRKDAPELFLGNRSLVYWNAEFHRSPYRWRQMVHPHCRNNFAFYREQSCTDTFHPRRIRPPLQPASGTLARSGTRSRLRESEKPVYFLSARAPISRAKLRLMIGAAINARWCSLFGEVASPRSPFPRG